MLVASVNSNIVKKIHTFFTYFSDISSYWNTFCYHFVRYYDTKKKTGRGCNLLYSCSSEITKREHLSRDKKKVKIQWRKQKNTFLWKYQQLMHLLCGARGEKNTQIFSCLSPYHQFGKNTSLFCLFVILRHGWNNVVHFTHKFNTLLLFHAKKSLFNISFEVFVQRWAELSWV